MYMFESSGGGGGGGTHGCNKGDGVAYACIGEALELLLIMSQNSLLAPKSHQHPPHPPHQCRQPLCCSSSRLKRSGGRLPVDVDAHT